MSRARCLVLLDNREWPADAMERRESFDARLRHAFAHRVPLGGLVSELHQHAERHAPAELRGLVFACLRSIAAANSHDSVSFALLRAVRDAVSLRR